MTDRNHLRRVAEAALPAFNDKGELRDTREASLRMETTLPQSMVESYNQLVSALHPAAVLELLDALDAADNQFICLECGTRVKADEEACCSSCGRDCLIVDGGELHHGDVFVSQIDALEDARVRIAALEALLREARRYVETAVGEEAYQCAAFSSFNENRPLAGLLTRIDAALSSPEVSNG